MSRGLSICIICLTLAMAFSCSTTRVLPEGQYRLVSNSVELPEGSSVKASNVEPYISLKPSSSFLFGWSPFMNVYNWSSRKGSSRMDRFLRKIGEAPVVYDSLAVAYSANAIQRHLVYLGYYGSTVDTKLRTKGKKAYVTYQITPGKQFIISDISFSLPKTGPFREDFLSTVPEMTVKIGTPLSLDALEKESVAGAARMRELGYYTFSKNNYYFQADTLFHPDSAALELRIEPYERGSAPDSERTLDKYLFHNVSLSYPSTLKIREEVLRKINTISPGDPYSESAVTATYNRLSSLRLFSGVNVALTPVSDKDLDCDIKLTPSRLQGFKAKIEGSSNSTGLLGISPELSYYNKNIFKGGEWFNLGFLGNFQFKPYQNVRSTEFAVSSSISIPRFVFLPYDYFKGNIPRTEFRSSYNYQNRPEYIRNIISTSYGYSGSSGKFYYQFYPAQINIVRLFNIDESFLESLSNNPFMRSAYQDHFDIGSGATLFYTTDPSVNPKGGYKYARLQFDIAGNALSLFRGSMRKNDSGSSLVWGIPFSQYVRTELTLGRTWRFGNGDSQAFATRLLAGAGLAYGNSDALPFEQHFYAGGASSMRGWQARSLGPGTSAMETSFIIPNQTGDMKLEANAEYRFHAFWKFDGALFMDVGNIWTFKGDGRFSFSNLGESIGISWGPGLRLDLNFILVRLDLGIILHDPSRPSGDKWVGPSDWSGGSMALHFGVGYPF